MVGARGYCAACGIPREPNVDACPLCGVPYPHGSGTFDDRTRPAPRHSRPPAMRIRGGARIFLYLMLAALTMVLAAVVAEIAALI
jgi:hypothetical protein